MQIIQDLSDMIEEEIADAGKYARCALKHKEGSPALGEMFFKLANEELGHMSTLHTQVVSMIEDYRKKNGDPPEHMLMLYNILHKKHIENAAAVKGMLSLYKG
jgi:ferritin